MARTQEQLLCNDVAQVRANILTLNRYRRSAEEWERAYYQDKMANGACYVCWKIRGIHVFGPSRFVGYRGNSALKHERNEIRDGGVTNRRLEQLLHGKFAPNRKIERHFQEYCAKNGVSASKRIRKYLLVGETSPVDEELVSEEIQAIRADQSIDKTTQAQLIEARVGQGKFRKQLLRYWKSRCAITGCDVPVVLRASHIKPWSESTNEERLDPFNGLLLSANADLLFEHGYLSITDDGRILLSPSLSEKEFARMGIRKGQRLKLDARHMAYLRSHCERRFKHGK